MLHKTIYGKSTRGGHEARTVVPMGPVTSVNGPGERILTIHTWKSGRGLLTHASCAVTANGATIMEIFGDFSKRVLLTSARCTRLVGRAVGCHHSHRLRESVVKRSSSKPRKLDSLVRLLFRCATPDVRAIAYATQAPRTVRAAAFVVLAERKQ